MTEPPCASNISSDKEITPTKIPHHGHNMRQTMLSVSLVSEVSIAVSIGVCVCSLRDR